MVCFKGQRDGKVDVYCLELISHSVFVPYFLAAYTHANLADYHFTYLEGNISLVLGSIINQTTTMAAP